MGKNMKEALLYEKLGNGIILCNLCAHNCRIMPDTFGICGVRKNVDGVLYTSTYGHLIATNIDPIEKKPLYHFLPGSKTFSIAAPGCNFQCGFCQNWQISQIRNRASEQFAEHSKLVPPEEIVSQAIDSNCSSIAFTYTEPTVFYEYMIDVSRLARSRGVRLVIVSNGYMSEVALETLTPYIDAYNIDLKSLSEDFYRENCHARLKPVLDTLQHIKQFGKWLEVTTLVIPGENDSIGELEGIAAFIAGIGPETPWHISRFFPNYRFDDYMPTPINSLENALEAAKKNHLKYVYIGNTAHSNTTSCSSCGNPLIERRGYSINSSIKKEGKCPSCGEGIYGVWE
jgi:pyruvate formate lyase activating enzyme